MKTRLEEVRDALSQLAMITEYFRLEEQIIAKQKEGHDPVHIGGLVEKQRDLQIKIDANIAERESDVADP